MRPTELLVRGDSATMTERGRRQVIAAYERRVETEIRLPRLGYSVSRAVEQVEWLGREPQEAPMDEESRIV